MKGNSLKTVFIILIILLIVFAVYYNLTNKKNDKSNNEEVEMFSGEKLESSNLRIGITEFDNINPILSNNKNVQDISRLIFDPLFELTEDYKLVPNLAKECSKIDNTTYIVKLKENIKWHDGRSFDSDDVCFTINMIQKQGTNSVYYYNIKNIAEVQKIDEYTIKVLLNEEVPYFEYNLIFPIVSSKYFNSDNFMLEDKNIKPVGTGKFYISETDNNSILLKKNDNSENSNNIKMDAIFLKLYDSLSNTINAFKLGQIDIFITSNGNIDEYLKNQNYSKAQYRNRNYQYIALNCSNQILSNKEVRQAINYAIDKDNIIKEIYNDRYIKSNFFLDFGSFAYDSNNRVINYDENVAKNILVENGWKYTSKKWRKTVNGRYLKIELNIISKKNNFNMMRIANKLKEQLERIGLYIKIVEATDEQYNNYLNQKNYDLIILENTYGYSPSLKKYFGEDNLANYQNENINALLDEIQLLDSDSDIKQKCSQIVDMYNDEVPYICLCYNTSTLIYSTSLKGVIKPNSYNVFYGIEDWCREYEK